MNIIFSTKDTGSQIQNLPDADMTTFVDIIRSINNIIPDADIRIFELLKEVEEEAPTKKGLVIADAINQILGNTRTIVYGKEPDKYFNEIGIKTISGSCFDHFILCFTSKDNSAELIITDDYSFFTYTF